MALPSLWERRVPFRFTFTALLQAGHWRLECCTDGGAGSGALMAAAETEAVLHCGIESERIRVVGGFTDEIPLSGVGV